MWAYLVIGNQNHSGGEITSQAAAWKPVDLALHALVAGDMDGRGGPPLGHGQDQEGHALFGEGHEAVVVVFVEQIERCSNVLSDSYAGIIQPW